MSETNIFISWSGKRSLYVAEALCDWLPNVIQAAKPWMSDRNIEKGTKGFTEIGKALEGKKVGIVCLTPENLEAVWILYEAGALSKTFSDDKTRLCTYLLGDLQSQDVKPPLSMFQWTKAEKEDTRKLVQTVNTAISEEPLPAERLNTIFNTFWPHLEEKLKAMPAPEKIVDARRDPNEMISEILNLCRQYLPGRDNIGFDLSAFNRLDVLRRALITDVSSRSIMVKIKGSQEYQVIHNVTGVSEMGPGTILVSQLGGTGSGFANVEQWGYLSERKSTETGT